jgi:DNA mismatch endonuclease (patch repair protein)
MADVFSKKKRSEVMAAIRSKGNRDTELRLMSILKTYKISGWRRHSPLPGKPDFAFRRERVVVFIDGCFWHNCPLHGRTPTTNRSYWVKKMERNRKRDLRVNQLLIEKGWRVLRFWEHQLKEHNILAMKIQKALKNSVPIAARGKKK